MVHYVCLFCSGVSDRAKVCETEGCENEGHQLKECDCTDDQHEEVLSPR